MAQPYIVLLFSKLLPIQHSIISKSLMLPNSAIQNNNVTMAQKSSRNLSSSNAKSTTPAARQFHAEKHQHVPETLPEQGRVGHWSRLPRSAKASWMNSLPLPSSVPANSTTPSLKGDSILPISSTHSMMWHSQHSNGMFLDFAFIINCQAS